MSLSESLLVISVDLYCSPQALNSYTVVLLLVGVAKLEGHIVVVYSRSTVFNPVRPSQPSLLVPSLHLLKFKVHSSMKADLCTLDTI